MYDQPPFQNAPHRLTRASKHWYVTKDGDPRGRALYERHYSCRRYQDGRVRRLFCGPGEKLVLISKQADALFVWRRQKFSMDGRQGVNCAVFRNEGPVRSSRLIKEAMAIAWSRWQGERLYTYVNPRRIQSSNPGYCFKQAGWKRCGITKAQHLIILAAEISAR
jgi:hypothetical protein